jgi:hypothetical protein
MLRKLTQLLTICYLSNLYSLYEVPGRDHWWDDVLSNDKVQKFLDLSPRSSFTEAAPPNYFTFTITTPAECGSLYGWRVDEVKIPGRLARLTIHIVGGTAAVNTTNVWSFSIDTSVSPTSMITVDGGEDLELKGVEKVWWFSKQKGHWEVSYNLQTLFVALFLYRSSQATSLRAPRVL